MSDKPLLYSYVRFSTPEQAKGHSLKRQLTYAKNVADERGLVLDEALSMKDLGLSAYHGTNITKGAFGVFLKAIDQGRIPSGSILLIESLDRLSRRGVTECSGIVTQIINAGITVITAIDNKEYNKQLIDSNPFELFAMLMIFIRANEESETKSKRVRDVLKQQCDDWVAGKRGFRVKCGKAPNWVSWDVSNEKFIFKVREKQIILKKIELYQKGYGGMKIAELINEEFGAGTVHHTGANVYKEVKRYSLVGKLEVEIGHQKYLLTDYYPKLLEDLEFESLHNDSIKRGAIKYSQKFVGILSGIDVFKCGECGRSVSSHVTYRRKKAEDVPSGHKRYGCVEARRNNNCTMKTTIQVDVIEQAVVLFCQDKVNLRRLLLGEHDKVKLRSNESQLSSQLENINIKINRLANALADAEEDNPLTVIKLINQLEAEAKALESKIEENKRRQTKVDNSFRDVVSDRWLALTQNLTDLDSEMRLALRPLVKDTFKSITLQTGINKNQAFSRVDDLITNELIGHRDANSSDLTMEFHNGKKRVLRLNSKSGQILRGFDL